MENSAPANDASGYTVVARRYRPRSFAELIGQDHIAHALHTAIASGRVGHAYLFTGARGVGKTSSARIFAKALNAPEGLEQELATDISHAIDSGEDMDVIEIDGASNRGIEEIRQLRANVNVRPSRSKYKIYIIDEVHMLTNQAFNALLKTLEEPPPHVKFIFCTTDPDKLPITVLSRCQRFDFVPIRLDAIQARLKQICEAEGYSANEDALALLARRAAGSMRDSQSLLEQVMSFSQGQITVDQIQQLLGIADEGRLLAMSETLASNDALRAIVLVDEASRSGADAGQLAEQLLNYFRDLMAVGIGGGPELLKLANPAGHARLKEIAQQWGVQSILSAIQILDESLVRMRSSVAASALLEVALVQICQLSQLASIPALLDAVRDGTVGRVAISPSTNVATNPVPQTSSKATTASPVKTAASEQTASEKKNDSPTSLVSSPISAPPSSHDSPSRDHPTDDSPRRDHPTDDSLIHPQTSSASPLEPASTNSPASEPAVAGSTDTLQLWRAAISSIGDMLADYAGLAVAVEPNGSDQWNVVFPPGNARPREVCEQTERRRVLEQAVTKVVQRNVRLTFSMMPGEAPRPATVTQPSNHRVQKMREVAENPYVKKLCEVIDGEILRVDPPTQILAGPKGASPHRQSV